MKIKLLVNQIVAWGLVAMFTLPLAWMFASSLRPPGLPPARGMEWLPDDWTLLNYGRMAELVPIGRYLLNSLWVAGWGVLFTLLSASWAGLGMALLPWSARLRLLLLSFGLQTIPITALLLTRFLLFARIGLTNSHLALTAPALMGTSPLFVLLFYWTFRRVDRAVFESALLDGAGPLRAWWFIALPLARPALMAVAMLAFLFYWNDFTGPWLYLRSQSMYTLPVGLLQLQQLDRTDWPLLMAAGVVMSLPPLVVFGMLQRSLLWWRLE